MLRVLLPLLAVGLAVYALVDLASSDEEERGGIPKGLWIVLIILLPFLGPIAWILVKRSSRRGARSTGGRPVGGRGAGGARRRRDAPLAPDDDPEFLWRLEQQQRRQARDEARPPTADDAPSADRDAADDGRTEGDGDAPRPGASNGSDDGDDAR
ncbi:PLD nuclease N-terminal domain-containing protein [Cellulosimicrobium protaetiae]|uniref:PLDc_N domain-containing protein n=1 Tax=Cellulosimicrobium protaetiae TaxID=2587808 RepID=A0A6M5UJG3_9MICO|nr:PLD nuclease N-terminal domain-containing protein [Cellulosimicrobium protaetiae]QJW37662.1 PLDc_N domain-containing protein [Cellulosimicrobium protaetiae]